MPPDKADSYCFSGGNAIKSLHFGGIIYGRYSRSLSTSQTRILRYHEFIAALKYGRKLISQLGQSRPKPGGVFTYKARSREVQYHAVSSFIKSCLSYGKVTINNRYIQVFLKKHIQNIPHLHHTCTAQSLVSHLNTAFYADMGYFLKTFSFLLDYVDILYYILPLYNFSAIFRKKYVFTFIKNIYTPT